MFYHIFIPRRDLENIQAHATRLVNASRSSETWRSSSYKNYIGYLSASTLTQLHQSWSHYTGTKDMTISYHVDFDQRMRNGVDSVIEKRNMENNINLR